MKIFGIGLSKAGTTSLNVALKILGYNARQYPQPPLMPKLLDQVEKYDALCDVPIAHTYKELDKIYPNSKFILTTRSLKSWLRSVKGHEAFHEVLYAYGEYFWDPDAQKLREEFYNCPVFDEEKWTNKYHRHHKEVLDYFKDRDDLLIMNITEGDGWEKLCPFLGKEIPDKPFPHEMKTPKKYKDYTKK